MGMVINLLVHPTNESPGMWRWAVHLGEDWTNPTSCLNAGATRNATDARLAGSSVAAACTNLARRIGAPVEVGDIVELDDDPIVTPWPLVRLEHQ